MSDLKKPQSTDIEESGEQELTPEQRDLLERARVRWARLREGRDIFPLEPWDQVPQDKT